MLYDVCQSNNTAQYDQLDVIMIKPAGHIFSSGALQKDLFVISKHVELSEVDVELLLMIDKQVIIPKSILHCCIAAKKLINHDALVAVRNRRYALINKLRVKK